MLAINIDDNFSHVIISMYIRSPMIVFNYYWGYGIPVKGNPRSIKKEVKDFIFEEGTLNL